MSTQFGPCPFVFVTFATAPAEDPRLPLSPSSQGQTAETLCPCIKIGLAFALAFVLQNLQYYLQHNTSPLTSTTWPWTWPWTFPLSLSKRPFSLLATSTEPGTGHRSCSCSFSKQRRVKPQHLVVASPCAYLVLVRLFFFSKKSAIRLLRRKF